MSIDFWDGKWEENVLNSPEACGLELVGVVDNDPESDDTGFDLDIIVRDIRTGKLFHGSDSGCSCPIPFENVHSLADLRPVTRWEARRILGHNNF